MTIASPLKSIRWKMSLLASAMLGSVLLIFVFYLVSQLQNVLSDNVDAELKVKTHELSQTIKAFQETQSPGGNIHFAAIKVLGFEVEPDSDASLELADRQWLRLIDRYDLDRDYVSVIGLDGAVLASNQDIPGSVQQEFRGMFIDQPRIRPVWRTIEHNGSDLRVLQQMILARDEPHYLIQIATPMVSVGQFFEGRILPIVVSIVVVIGLFSLVGLLLANQILQPVRKIAQAAEELTHKDLSQRVGVEETDQEMRFLVKAFNNMTQRLETAFKELSEMTGRIAHELKTPLAVIKGEGQAALRQDRKPEDYRAVIESSIAETDRMLQVINDLLLDADIAYDRHNVSPDPISLGLFLEDICKKSQILSEPKSIQVDLELPQQEITIYGDRTHLRRMFFNLMDNAIKASPPKTSVQITATIEKGGVLISIKDEGPGISPNALPDVFYPQQGASVDHGAKHPFPRGNGLGLRLCWVIARAHRGKLHAANHERGGAVFSVFLPADLGTKAATSMLALFASNIVTIP